MEKSRELEPIAIIGMSCRLPGGAASPEQLWDKLANGVSAWSTAPKERFNLDGFHDPANTHATTVSNLREMSCKIHDELTISLNAQDQYGRCPLSDTRYQNLRRPVLQYPSR